MDGDNAAKRGEIVGCKYVDGRRGMVDDGKKCLKNNVMITMMMEHRSICVKVSEERIHLCGCKTIEEGDTACEIFMSCLKSIQSELDYMNSNPVETLYAIRLFSQECQGEEVSRYDYSTSILEKKDGTSMPIKLAIGEQIDHLVKNVDLRGMGRVASFLNQHVIDFIYMSELMSFIRKITTLNVVMSPDVNIKNIKRAMVNHNYSLPYRIDRNEFRDAIMSSNTGFKAYYDTIINSDTGVTIYMPFDKNGVKGIIRSSSKVPTHTITVGRTGAITHSGPSEDLNNALYQRFIGIVKRFEPRVRVDPYMIYVNSVEMCDDYVKDHVPGAFMFTVLLRDEKDLVAIRYAKQHGVPMIINTTIRMNNIANRARRFLDMGIETTELLLWALHNSTTVSSNTIEKSISKMHKHVDFIIDDGTREIPFLVNPLTGIIHV